MILIAELADMVSFYIFLIKKVNYAANQSATFPTGLNFNICTYDDIVFYETEKYFSWITIHFSPNCVSTSENQEKNGYIIVHKIHDLKICYFLSQNPLNV